MLLDHDDLNDLSNKYKLFIVYARQIITTGPVWMLGCCPSIHLFVCLWTVACYEMATALLLSVYPFKVVRRSFSLNTSSFLLMQTLVYSLSLIVNSLCSQRNFIALKLEIKKKNIWSDRKYSRYRPLWAIFRNASYNLSVIFAIKINLFSRLCFCFRLWFCKKKSTLESLYQNLCFLEMTAYCNKVIVCLSLKSWKIMLMNRRKTLVRK